MPAPSGHAIKSRQDAERLLSRRIRDLNPPPQPAPDVRSTNALDDAPALTQDQVREAITSMAIEGCIVAKVNGAVYTFEAFYERLYGVRLDGKPLKKAAAKA